MHKQVQWKSHDLKDWNPINMEMMKKIEAPTDMAINRLDLDFLDL